MDLCISRCKGFKKKFVTVNHLINFTTPSTLKSYMFLNHSISLCLFALLLLTIDFPGKIGTATRRTQTYRGSCRGLGRGVRSQIDASGEIEFFSEKKPSLSFSFSDSGASLNSVESLEKPTFVSIRTSFSKAQNIKTPGPFSRKKSRAPPALFFS